MLGRTGGAEEGDTGTEGTESITAVLPDGDSDTTGADETGGTRGTPLSAERGADDTGVEPIGDTVFCGTE